MLDGSFSILFGLYDLNSEFNALDFAGTLTNSSFGIQRDISQVGPSIFSTTALAIRLKYLVTDQVYAIAAVFDGIPGDPNNQRGTRVRFKEDEGVFSAVEVGYTSAEDSPHHKLALGGWLHTAQFEDFKGETQDQNGGGYVIAETSIFQEDDTTQGLGAFFQFGEAQRQRNQVAEYIGAGLNYTGLIPHRDEDVLAFGVAIARNGEAYRDAVEGSERAETVFEVSYRAHLLPYLAVQPDLQLVRNPGTDPTVKDAVVLGVRAEIAL